MHVKAPSFTALPLCERMRSANNVSRKNSSPSYNNSCERIIHCYTALVEEYNSPKYQYSTFLFHTLSTEISLSEQLFLCHNTISLPQQSVSDAETVQYKSITNPYTFPLPACFSCQHQSKGATPRTLLFPHLPQSYFCLQLPLQIKSVTDCLRGLRESSLHTDNHSLDKSPFSPFRVLLDRQV